MLREFEQVLLTAVRTTSAALSSTPRNALRLPHSVVTRLPNNVVIDRAECVGGGRSRDVSLKTDHTSRRYVRELQRLKANRASWIDADETILSLLKQSALIPR